METLIEQYLLNHFEPARDGWKDSTLQLSTGQIVDAITAHTGVPIDFSYVYQWMIDHGYFFDTLDGLQFVWLMKETN